MKRCIYLLIFILFFQGCHFKNSQPSLAPIGNQKVIVGETLKIELVAEDKDGDDLFFSVEYKNKKIEGASLKKTSKNTAEFVWSPIISDASSTGEKYEVTFYVEDGYGGIDSEDIVITVYRSGGVPEFLNPHGYILDLSKDEYITFLVLVKDDDSPEVDISMKVPIKGAILKKASKKSAEFYWHPDEQQIREKLFYTVIFQADDHEHPPVLYDISIILVNPTSDAKCTGSPPIIIFNGMKDQFTEKDYEIKAQFFDEDSTIKFATLMYRYKENFASEPQFQAVAMVPVEGTLFKGVIPNESPDPETGGFIDFYFTAADNDDITSEKCDHTARFPKDGYFTIGVYPIDSEITCADDDLEPVEDSASPYQISGSFDRYLRLCPGDSDWFKIFLNKGETVFISASATNLNEEIKIELFDLFKNKLKESVFSSGSSVLTFTNDSSSGESFLFKITSQSFVNLSYRLMVNASSMKCVNDGFEPNDTIYIAKEISVGEYENLMICPNDIDVYKILMQPGENLEVKIIFSQVNGDLDLVLLDEDGKTELSYSASESDNEIVQFKNSGSTFVYAVVGGYQNASNVYKLIVKKGSDIEFCMDDYLAPNSDATHSVTLIEGSYPDLTLCPAKEDWFNIGLNGYETFNIYVKGDVSPDNLHIEIFNEQFEELHNINKGIYDEFKFIAVPIKFPGTYFYKIYSDSLSVVNYELDIWADEPEGECHNDRFEPNDAPKDAPLIEKGITTYLKICGGDVDWFKVKLNAWESVTIYVLFYNEKGDINLYLYQNDYQTLIDKSESVDKNFEKITFVPEEKGEYYIKVIGNSVKDNFYDIAIIKD